ncbi:hypothetical protein CHS0354_019363 [Potamilus streckersoni]|uniref:Uncharacterized protein n=1 Tax=Potamilus streckersoni TaxID=2493646 RepID=A0AAE0SHZ6_9BIVA|nr:hypothetical protein CHS0354_019363 [Potamilus streckersoni]
MPYEGTKQRIFIGHCDRLLSAMGIQNSSGEKTEQTRSILQDFEIKSIAVLALIRSSNHKILDQTITLALIRSRNHTASPYQISKTTITLAKSLNQTASPYQISKTTITLAKSLNQTASPYRSPKTTITLAKSLNQTASLYQISKTTLPLIGFRNNTQLDRPDLQNNPSSDQVS